MEVLSISEVRKIVKKQEQLPPEEKILIFKRVKDTMDEIPSLIPQFSSKLYDNFNGESAMYARRIFLRQQDSKTYVINVTSDETIGHIKIRICKKEGILIDQQIYIYAGLILDDQKTIHSYGIENDCIIELFLKEDLVILDDILEPSHSVIGGGNPIFLDFGAMEISVKENNNEIMKINVLPSHKAKEIKDKIYMKLGIDPQIQSLSFEGKFLEDSKEISFMGLREGSTIHLTRKIKIYLRYLTGETLDLFVEPFNTIGSIKGMLQETAGIHHSRQIFIFACQQCEDRNTFSDYGIKKGDMITIVIRPEPVKQIFVSWEGFSFPLSVGPNFSIRDVKGLIQNFLNIAMAEQKLVFKGKELEDEKTLEDYYIQNETALSLLPKNHKSI